MYVVQFGNYIWATAAGLTTSAAHACPFAATETAEAVAERIRKDRATFVATLPERPRTLRAYYLSADVPVTVVPLAELRARLAERREPAETGDAAERAAVQPKGDKPLGVTRQIYNWCLDNPGATKADALAAWPTANPSTVGVQFGAARKAAK